MTKRTSPSRWIPRVGSAAVVTLIALIVVACGDDAPLKEPKVHRAASALCGEVRSAGVTLNPDTTGAPASCHSDVECTNGRNGRCSGNPHDGYACTYDQCASDTDCGAGVCQCDGGRGGNDVCLSVGCHTDADCKGDKSWCSPTLGSCGNYGGTVSWECHTHDDECTDDTDCSAEKSSSGTSAYCAFDKAVGHWKCAMNQCAG